MKKKFSIDVKTARQLEDMRIANNWSWKQMYAFYFGLGIDQSEQVDPLDADALRKQVERKKDRVPHSEMAGRVLAPTDLSTDKTISYDVLDDEVMSASGTVYLDDGKDLINDGKLLVKALFEEFNLDEKKYTLVKYTPSYVNKKFKVWARFEKRDENVYDEEAVVARYNKLLASIGSLSSYAVQEVDTGNILVINMADVHWNKMPYIGYGTDYLERFEQEVYKALNEIMEHSKNIPISRAVLTIGHDFFQTNDSRGTTKKGTQVSHIMDYKDMFDIGVRILSNAIYIVSRRYVTDCYYILANHDNDAGWHAARELKSLYKNVGSVNIIVDKMPFHHIEWGSTLIELIHENIKGGKGYTNMPVTAREAWGRTKYHYSIGGHLHGEYITKEKAGVVVMGSRALSDTDEWHYIEGYLGNIRGIQSYVFNRYGGHIATFNSNL